MEAVALVIVLFVITLLVIAVPPATGFQNAAILLTSTVLARLVPFPPLRELVDAHLGVWALVLLTEVASFLTLVIRTAGPVVADRARDFWLARSPTRRGGW